MQTRAVLRVLLIEVIIKCECWSLRPVFFENRATPRNVENDKNGVFSPLTVGKNKIVHRWGVISIIHGFRPNFQYYEPTFG